MKNFQERIWNDTIVGELDSAGFFYTPNGSFWDQDYVYFNREGYDKHGGYYDNNLNYIPGANWDDINHRYKGETDQDDDFLDEEGVAYHDDSRDFLEGEDFADINDPTIEKIQIKTNKYKDGYLYGDDFGDPYEKKTKQIFQNPNLQNQSKNNVQSSTENEKGTHFTVSGSEPVVHSSTVEQSKVNTVPEENPPKKESATEPQKRSKLYDLFDNVDDKSKKTKKVVTTTKPTANTTSTKTDTAKSKPSTKDNVPIQKNIQLSKDEPTTSTMISPIPKEKIPKTASQLEIMEKNTALTQPSTGSQPEKLVQVQLKEEVVEKFVPNLVMQTTNSNQGYYKKGYQKNNNYNNNNNSRKGKKGGFANANYVQPNINKFDQCNPNQFVNYNNLMSNNAISMNPTMNIASMPPTFAPYQVNSYYMQNMEMNSEFYPQMPMMPMYQQANFQYPNIQGQGNNLPQNKYNGVQENWNNYNNTK